MLSFSDFGKIYTIFMDSKPRDQMGLTGTHIDLESDWKIRFSASLMISGIHVENPDGFFDVMFLLYQYDILDIIILLGGFLKKPSTEIDSATIEAVKLLRDQFREPDISRIRKFQGVRKEGISALEFYETHYSEVKDRIHGGLLSGHDRKLYGGMAAELRRDGRSITEVVPSYESVLDQRRAAAAKLLRAGDVPDDAVNIFFSSLRRR
jgi:hypothetical protein